jgi:hypothetical protein
MQCLKLLAGLVVGLSMALAQLIPAGKLGVEVLQDNEATIFKKNGLEISYIPGLGWGPPLEATLPPPEGDKLPIEVVRAAGLVPAPEAVASVVVGQGRFRLIIANTTTQLPEVTLRPYSGQLTLSFPYFLPQLQAVPEVRTQYGISTTVDVKAPPGRIYRYKAQRLADSRYVVDVYYLLPERIETLAPGFTYREIWAWTPEPVRLYWLEAAAGSWSMQPVGKPGERKVLGQMAPGALALLNGGYFDSRTGTPIGLWVQDGVALNFPFGRSTLFWQEDNVFAGKPQFSARVQTMGGTSVKVGINTARARYTAYTVGGSSGRAGENIHVIQNDRIVATYPAPYVLPEGYWGLSFPPDAPIARTGDSLQLLGSLEPAVEYALEAGPLLIEAGKNIYSPDAEPFRDKAPLFAVAAQSVVAWTQDGGIWLIVSEPSRPEVMASVLQERGAWGAIRMDGGGSAQLWIRGKPQNSTGPRPVANGLAIYPKR